MRGKSWKLFFFSLYFVGVKTFGADDSVQGLYKAILFHEGSKLYQVADINLRTIQQDGTLKISATTKIFFGGYDSNEFLTYEYENVSYNWVTGQMSFRSDKSDVSMAGIFKPTSGTFEGEWYSSFIGRVGKMNAKRGANTAPEDGILAKTLTGYYRGSIQNTNPQSNLPERIALSLVTTQDVSGPTPVIRISGMTRLYLAAFDTFEFVETKFVDVSFNFYNRYFTARTAEYGLTFKGTVSLDGIFNVVIYSDGIGEAAKGEIKRFPSTI